MISPQKNKMLFEDINFDSSDRPLILNKPRLLEIIKTASRQTSMESLRKNIFSLREQLSDFKNDKTGLLNIGTNGDTIVLNQKYLFEELKQIVEAQTLERSRYYLNRLSKSILEEKTGKINDLNLNRWKEYTDIITDSLWILSKRDSSGVHNSNYWGNFIPQIPYQMIVRFTKKGEWILDTFAGCGTTLIESQRLGRNCIGIELQKNVVEIANNLIHAEPNVHHTINQVVQGNSVNIDYQALLKKYGRKSVQLLIMHPPYFDIIKFSKDPDDLSNATSLEDFLSKMRAIVQKASKVLDKGRYLVLVIGDKYSKGEWVPLGFLTMQEVLKCGFKLKSIIVKNFEETLGKRNQKDLWRYRALVGGFYVFKHEYIFLFQKSEDI